MTEKEFIERIDKLVVAMKGKRLRCKSWIRKDVDIYFNPAQVHVTFDSMLRDRGKWALVMQCANDLWKETKKC